jgi:predicted phosphodiesterase
MDIENMSEINGKEDKPEAKPEAFEKCRWLIMSDIHSNLEALNACLEAAGEAGYDRIACLGDLVGYGPNPNEVVSWAIGVKDLICVKGNHDLCVGDISITLDHYNYHAMLAIKQQRKMINEQTREFLMNLPLQIITNDMHLIHGSPYQWDEYIYDRWDASYVMGFVKADKCFVGHTHRPVIWKDSFDNPKIINVGSVGQPRDLNPMASFMIYDQNKNELEAIRVAYDIEEVQRKMTDLKMSEHLIARLKTGE